VHDQFPLGIESGKVAPAAPARPATAVGSTPTNVIRKVMPFISTQPFIMGQSIDRQADRQRHRSVLRELTRDRERLVWSRRP
jgi:hypothetical protein